MASEIPYNLLAKMFGGANVGSGLYNLFGGQNTPSGSAMPYYEGIPSKTSPYLNPYIDTGKNQLGKTSQQYTDLMNAPGKKINEIGQDFQQSPGFKFALDQALRAKNAAYSAGGLAGSPENSQEDMQLAMDLANQDYYKWLGESTGLYKEGLHGGQTQTEQGQKAATDMAQLVAQVQAALANAAAEKEAQKNKSFGGGIGQIISGIVPFLF